MKRINKVLISEKKTMTLRGFPVQSSNLMDLFLQKERFPLFQ